MAVEGKIRSAATKIDRDRFLRSLLRELAGSLEEVVGLDEAEAYIATAASALGRTIEADYRRALDRDRLDRDEVTQVLVDLKRRIGGGFRIIEEREDRVVLGNCRCPFGDAVRDRPSLCMLTSNVFGRITAENLGYARVELQETIARGDRGCRVVVHLEPGDDTRPDSREYFRETGPGRG